MSPLLLALALFLADAPAAAEAPAQPPAAEAPAQPAEAPFPPGAPHDDYQFVGWCYGVLRGYLDLHDEVMPEVTRIETTWRRPGASLASDLKVYSDIQKQGKGQLKLFQEALTAAEKASLQPINTLGAEAVRKGRSIWTAAPEVTTTRKAQEWMSWTLPARCETTARTLEKRAKLMGTAFKVNAEPEAAPVAPAEAPPPADAPMPNPAS